MNWDRDKYDLLLYLYTYRAIHHDIGYSYACDRVINILRERHGEYVTSEAIEFAMRKFDSISIVNNAENRYPYHRPIYTKRMLEYHRDVFINRIYGNRRWNTVDDLNHIMDIIGIQR